MTKEIPEGFEPHFRKSKVTDPWEPLFSKRINNTIQIGLRLNENHCNSRGFAHGGVIATLADNAMGISAIVSSGNEGKISAVTLNLNLDYISSAQQGQWLQIEPRVINTGKSIAFIDALITADEKTIAKASAVFRFI